MAHAYTPGLKVAPCVRHRARRLLPIPGEVVVAPGDRVAARDVVAETFMPGDVTPLNMANLLSLPPGDAAACMIGKEGGRIEIGQVLARTKGIFGLFKSEYKSKVAGTIESISSTTGQVIVRGQPQPLRVTAYLAGEVVEVIPREGVVIEADATLVQGIFGIGGEAFGPIHMAGPDPHEPLTAEQITEEMRDAVVVGGGRVTDAALRKAVQVGAAAIVTGGIDDQDLKGFLGYDLGVAITGSEKAGLTLVITEGFGEIAMADRTWRLLQSRQGAEAAVNGTTQIRAGVIRPEIVVPWGSARPADGGGGSDRSAVGPAGQLTLGVPVRIIRDPYFGQLGRVAALPPEPRVLASGSKARVVEVAVESGGCVTVPRANVELIEE
jgi:hypothetical protein